MGKDGQDGPCGPTSGQGRLGRLEGDSEGGGLFMVCKKLIVITEEESSHALVFVLVFDCHILDVGLALLLDLWSMSIESHIESWILLRVRMYSACTSSRVP